MKRFMIVVTLVFLVLPALFVLTFKTVQPMDLGVKQIRFGGSGVVLEDFSTGYHLGISGYHRWYFLPATTHFLHFVSGRGSSTNNVVWERPLRIRTKDNNETEIELTVPYRIKAGEAHKIVMKGLRESYAGRVKSTVEKVLRTQLAELTSEDFQDTLVRRRQALSAVPILNEQLSDFHVEADTVLVRRVSFPPEYEQKLQEKQYLTQKANLDRALALVANEEKVTNSLERQIMAAEAELTANWDKDFQSESSRFEVLIAEINAQARIYSAQVTAEADAELVRLEADGQLALDRAEALRDELRNEALGCRGGQVYLALQAAERLEVPRVTLNSNDPRVPMVLDLQELTNLLVGPSQPPNDTP
jgi:hypothetical protein